jgi:hypothetical protein
MRGCQGSATTLGMSWSRSIIVAISTSKQTSAAAAAVRALNVSWRGYQRRPDHVTTTDFQSDSEDHHRPALRLAVHKHPDLKLLS